MGRIYSRPFEQRTTRLTTDKIEDALTPAAELHYVPGLQRPRPTSLPRATESFGRRCGARANPPKLASLREPKAQGSPSALAFHLGILPRSLSSSSSP
jgi:hypothetical protein